MLSLFLFLEYAMETFQTIKPKNKSVLPYISYYYFHDSDETDFARNFVFYPHFKHGFTVYKENNSYKTLFTMNYGIQFPVSLRGVFHKIGVAFQPLGINYFVTHPLVDIYNTEQYLFTHWNPEIEIELANVFEATDIERKRDLLDEIFEKRLQQVSPEIHVVQKAIQLIFDSNGTITVVDLVQNLNISRKTLLRYFKKHLCTSIETYKKVVKFRLSLQATQNGNLKNFTEVSLFSLYYDQSDFTNRFKELTGQNPKMFFNSIKKMGEEDIYWTIN